MAEDSRKIATDGTVGARPEQPVQKFSPLPTGTKLGEMIIQTVLGAGEFGITYIAEHIGTGRRYALKEYMPRAIAFRDGPTVRVSAASTPAFAWGLDRFVSEGRALAKIKHPAIVAVQAAIEGNGTGYVAMAHEAGRDLAIWQHELRRPPSQEEQDKILAPLLEGLALVHAQDLMHLEITPANILVRDNGTPVLIDFGAVRIGMRRRLNLPTPADIKPYMSPEVAAADQKMIGPRSDIYSLSAVLYAMTTGTPPPVADQRVLRDELAPTAQSARGKFRPGFLAGIDAGLSFRPDDRPQQVGGWQDELLVLDAAKPGARKQDGGKAEPAAAATTGGSASGSAPVEAGRRRFSYPEDTQNPDEAAQAATAEQLMDNPAFRSMFFGGLGALGGALAGALSSVVVASIVWSSCVTDSCVMPVLPFTAAAGTLVGLYFGMQYGRTSARNQPRLSTIDED